MITDVIVIYDNCKTCADYIVTVKQYCDERSINMALLSIDDDYIKALTLLKEYGANMIPHTLFLNEERRVLASIGGVIPYEELITYK